jgi:hypothetical protein
MGAPRRTEPRRGSRRAGVSSRTSSRRDRARHPSRARGWCARSRRVGARYVQGRCGATAAAGQDPAATSPRRQSSGHRAPAELPQGGGRRTRFSTAPCLARARAERARWGAALKSIGEQRTRGLAWLFLVAHEMSSDSRGLRSACGLSRSSRTVLAGSRVPPHACGRSRSWGRGLPLAASQGPARRIASSRSRDRRVPLDGSQGPDRKE